MLNFVRDVCNAHRDVDSGGHRISLKRHLKELLGGVEDVDFLLVLATAEKLRPGVYEFVMTKRVNAV